MIRVFPRRTKWTPTDELAFVGDPPLFRPEQQPVHISATFTWEIEEARRLARAWGAHYRDVEVGGPAFDDPGGEFEPGRFLKRGVTITSRGCVRSCPWCFVPTREGRVREIEIKPGWIIQDNNLLACSRGHIEAVFDMLRGQSRAAIFSGGLDAVLLKPWHVDLLESIRVGEIWVACDSENMVPITRAASMLQGFEQRRKRCYVMIGFGDETLADAEKRLESVYGLGFLPFAQLYRGKGERKYNRSWRALNKKWSRPAAYRKPKGGDPGGQKEKGQEGQRELLI